MICYFKITTTTQNLKLLFKNFDKKTRIYDLNEKSNKLFKKKIITKEMTNIIIFLSSENFEYNPKNIYKIENNLK